MRNKVIYLILIVVIAVLSYFLWQSNKRYNDAFGILNNSNQSNTTSSSESPVLSIDFSSASFDLNIAAIVEIIDKSTGNVLVSQPRNLHEGDQQKVAIINPPAGNYLVKITIYNAENEEILTSKEQDFSISGKNQEISFDL